MHYHHRHFVGTALIRKLAASGVVWAIMTSVITHIPIK